jgi:Uma2 family endonuclease
MSALQAEDARDDLLQSLYEVIDGEYVEKPMSMREIRLANALSQLMAAALGKSPPGEAFMEMLYRLPRGNSRRPDVSYVSYERWSDRVVPETEAWEMVPLVAVEIISKNNKAGEIQGKIEEYFDAGVSQVWVVYPKQKKVMVYRSPKDVQVLDESDLLDGGTLLPGFKLALRDFFRL